MREMNADSAGRLAVRLAPPPDPFPEFRRPWRRGMHTHEKNRRRIANVCQGGWSKKLTPAPIGVVIQPPAVSTLRPPALRILRENVRDLIWRQGLSQVGFAKALGHERSWANKFLAGTRSVTLEDLDKIAGLLKVDPYQLFQPGLSQAFDRRRRQRRTGPDRRKGSSMAVLSGPELIPGTPEEAHAKHARALDYARLAALASQAMQDFAIVASALDHAQQAHAAAAAATTGHRPAPTTRPRKPRARKLGR